CVEFEVAFCDIGDICKNDVRFILLTIPGFTIGPKSIEYRICNDSDDE
ncbi:unnamed protein product, partial [Rotaria magnacalcarata]